MDQLVGASGAIRGVRVLDALGGFSAPCDVQWDRGRFTSITPTTESVEEPRWLIPGIVDAHLHAAWHRFDAPHRPSGDPDLLERETRRALRATLHAGVTSCRDAGGLTPALTRSSPLGEGPRVQTSVSMLDRAAVDQAGSMARAVAQVLDAGAQWVKLVATASVTSPPGAGLEPVFEQDEMREAVRTAASAGAGVMVHAWGGPAIDHAIEVGAWSIEHGIFLTDEQASAAAAHGMTFVPTLRIYRLVQQMIARGQLPAALRARVDEAVGAHPEAVRRARDAGLNIALGTDYGTTEQHGTNLLEFDALVGDIGHLGGVDAPERPDPAPGAISATRLLPATGLTPGEALLAATRGGAELLRRADPSAPSGRIAVGEIADALILRKNPWGPGALSSAASTRTAASEPDATRSTDAISAILLGGETIVPDPPRLIHAHPNREEHQ
ncbi:amidohydrolase family protein [Leucobacter sp. GX24907]